jgi:chromosome partitioning protein
VKYWLTTVKLLDCLTAERCNCYSDARHEYQAVKTLSIVNQKGGVGKTSTAVNLAFALGRLQKRVLLVDLDPQASLTEYFLTPKEIGELAENTADLLLQTIPIQPRSVRDNIDLLPSSIDLSVADVQLPAKLNSQKTLARMLKSYAYDYVLIDCLPSLGILTINALTASDAVLVPVEPEIMAERTVKLILNTIAEIRETELNPNLQIWRILPTKFDSRLAHHKEVLEAIKAKHAWLVYPEPVKSTTKYKDAVTSREDISHLDKELGEYWDRMARAFIKDYSEGA